MARDQGYINDERFNELLKSFKRLSVMISNMIAYLRNSRMKGEKFKKPPYRTMKEEMDEVMKSLNR